ncbi:hypothetical protein JOC37_001303 [Desulfohalotomaculum tongense]|uniref:hypothetical protein n=1 Tax=Desulforadius tongensis TaxID=1216062 RepID=UPI00195D218E|nr:hypothetical protein [Desulforadius tongensis]MBM7854923.1 hypothetical protein [Desulforadius tongensis]
MKDNLKRLKRVVIKEEFVALTGDITKAILLNQFIYWSERVRDFDKFIAEEISRARKNGVEKNFEPTNGWIYKTAEELSEETMLNLAPANIRKHLSVLVKNGWLSERTNPEYKWDRTKQYRVNILKIQQDLLKLGYILQDYKVAVPFNESEIPFSETENAFHETKNGIHETKNAYHEIKNGFHKTKNQINNSKNQTERIVKAIPEITYRDYNTEIKMNDEEEEDAAGKSEKTKHRLTKTKTDEQLYDDYEETAVHYFQKIGEDENILPYIYRWVQTYGKERVMYVVDRLAEQDKKINNVIRWMEKALKKPEKYPPKISYKKDSVDTKKRCGLYDALLMS